VSAAGSSTPESAAPPTSCSLGPAPPSLNGASSDQWSRAACCHFAGATAAGVTPKPLCSFRRCRSSSCSDSTCVDRIVPKPAGITPARVPAELATASTGGGPNSGAPDWRYPFRGER